MECWPYLTLKGVAFDGCRKDTSSMGLQYRTVGKSLRKRGKESSFKVNLKKKTRWVVFFFFIPFLTFQAPPPPPQKKRGCLTTPSNPYTYGHPIWVN